MSATGNPYNCSKCGGSAAETGQIRAGGGALPAMFDVSTETFTWVACARCGYTEFWRGGVGVGVGVDNDIDDAAQAVAG